MDHAHNPVWNRKWQPRLAFWPHELRRHCAHSRGTLPRVQSSSAYQAVRLRQLALLRARRACQQAPALARTQSYHAHSAAQHRHSLHAQRSIQPGLHRCAAAGRLNYSARGPTLRRSWAKR